LFDIFVVEEAVIREMWEILIGFFIYLEDLEGEIIEF
jgi:hypothetical protein